MRIFLIIVSLVLVASAIVALLAFIRRSRKGAPGSFGRRSNITVGVILAAVLGLLAWVAWPGAASAGDDDDDSDDNDVKELTINVDEFDACIEGVESDDPVFFVRGSDVTHKHSVMPPLPENDPDGVIEAIFGPRGYACLDPSVAVEVSQVQEGMIKFLEREDVEDINEWVSYLVSNPKAWEDLVDKAVKRFEGISWDPAWTPEDGDATFMLSDANMGQQYPRLVQREEGVPASGFPAYRFLNYMGDQPLLKDLALIQETGWLALPEGKFNQVTEIDLLEEPLVTPETTTTTTSPQDEQNEQQDQQGQDQADTNDGGGTNQTNQSNANDGGGGNATGGGSNSGSEGGSGGGSGSGCGDSGCGTGGGSGGSGSGGGGCNGCGGSITPTPTHTTPTTRPPTTRPTVPPTTRPTVPPTTRPTVPPTTKPDPVTTTTTVPCPAWAC